jgi:SEFIR domain
MPGSVRLRLGNLFDGPSDLIVLPCSTSGTITGFVARSLAHYSIPHPQVGMQLGTVEFMPFEGGENIAQFVAFAASVRGGLGSKLEAIRAVGHAIGTFAQEHTAVKAIAAPLLGAGTGGLKSDDVVIALKEGFCESAPNDACMTISVLHRDIYDRLRSGRYKRIQKAECPIRVFISHTSKTPEEVNWVTELALFLIDKGIQARLDKFHLRRGMDLPQWMCNELALATRVVIVSNEAYKAKADGREGGVGWETMVIQGDLASLPHDSTKYQVVVRAERLNDGLPLYLRTRYAFHCQPSDTANSFRDELVRELLDLPLDERLEANECYL